MDNIKDIALTSPAKWGTIAGKIDENLRESAGARTVTYSTDVATTRKQIKSEERKYGLILNYVHPELGDIQERYIGKTTDDSSWQNNANWEEIIGAKKYAQLDSNITNLNNNVSRIDSAIYVNLIQPNSNSVLADSAYYYSDYIQYILRGRKITKIQVEIVKAGTFSVVKGVNLGTEQFIEEVIQTFSVVVGVQTLIFDSEVLLEVDEYIGFLAPTDTSIFKYYADTDSNFYYKKNGYWYGDLKGGNEIGRSSLSVDIYSDDGLLQEVGETARNLNTWVNPPLIAWDKITSDVSIGTSSGFYYAEGIQKRLYNKEITSIAVNIAKSGSFSILKATNVGTDNFSFSIVKTFSTKLGINELMLDVPLILNQGEYIGFQASTDDARFFYYASSLRNFTFQSSTDGNWATVTSLDFNDDTSTLSIQIFAGQQPLIDYIKRTINSTRDYPNNKLNGKTFSILADSISTFNGYIPSGYATFYPRGDVNVVDNTWWKMLESDTDMRLLKNCSWSGSTCTGISNSLTSAFAGCSDLRIADLKTDEETPDIIICYIGINDWGTNKDLGQFDDTANIPAEGNITNFADAYMLMVDKIMKNYPKSMLYCCTLPNAGNDSYDTSDPGVYPPINSNGIPLYRYNQVIRNICHALGVTIIELNSCGITFYNMEEYTIGDKLHPSKSGMTLIKEMVKYSL